MVQLTKEGEKILAKLIQLIAEKQIKAGELNKYPTYGEIHDILGLKMSGNTIGQSLNGQGLGNLANWTHDEGHPAITGLVIDKSTGEPGPGYFNLFGIPEKGKYEWWEKEIENALEYDWYQFLPRQSRQKFIESHDATCENWRQSWSFVNEKEKFVIFGAWTDMRLDENTYMILSEEWEERAGKKRPPYKWARNHIRLVEEKGYRLKTYPMIREGERNDTEPSKIKEFIPQLTEKSLKKSGNSWYATDDDIDSLTEEVDSTKEYWEGTSKRVSVNIYERNLEARRKCLDKYGYICSVCTFDFEKVYGSIGKKYIHVHHKVPLSDIDGKYKLNPLNDLIPVCPNCHAMIHRDRKKPALSVEELKKRLKQRT